MARALSLSRVDLRQHLSRLYASVKATFAQPSLLKTSTLIGLLREEVASALLAFFPEVRQKGWILDRDNESTGEIDIVLVHSRALSLPGTLLGQGHLRGFLASDVVAAIEVKSNIQSDVRDVSRKVLECHRFRTGDKDDIFTDQVVMIRAEPPCCLEPPPWVPVLVLGAHGYSSPTAYEAACLSELQTLLGDSTSITLPEFAEDSPIADLTLDVTRDSLTISSRLQPERIIDILQLASPTVTDGDRTKAVVCASTGDLLLLLLFYLDFFRGHVYRSADARASTLVTLFGIQSDALLLAPRRDTDGVSTVGLSNAAVASQPEDRTERLEAAESVVITTHPPARVDLDSLD